LLVTELTAGKQVIKRLLAIANYIDAIGEIDPTQCAQRQQLIMWIIFNQ
jgi:hypothetical protein